MNIRSIRACSYALVLTLLVGCSTSQGTSDTTVAVGTFNIQWLGDGVSDKVPRTDAEYLLIADIIAKTGADVMALEEVENTAALNKVLRYLDGYDGAVSTAGSAQRVAVVYRTGLHVRVIGDYTPLQLDRPERLRPGLVLECKKGSFSWIQMCVHLKSTSRYDSTTALVDESRSLRTQQAQVIKDFVDSVIAAGQETDVIITGDFNDYPGRRSNPTLDVLANSSLVFLTRDMKSCANPKWTTIDHVLASPTAAARAISGSARMENQREYLSDADANMVSDHCPVVVKFSCAP